ncbi:MAG TPA: ABC transporter ATP-binding protein/permease [Stellaceae bacterium]|nr:ABC transporter ATP-binding protein/permease [Stellaceae bacterium]
MRGALRSPMDGTTRDQPPAPFREQLRAVGGLVPYLWPKGEPAIRLRVVVAVVLIVAAKVLNAGVPFSLKLIVDALARHLPGPAAAPVALIALYGVVRLAAFAAAEFRELIFAKVVQRAIRLIALRVFEHLHGLSLRFHLERQMGGLSRAIERGTTGIEYLLGLTLFSLLPTFIELSLVTAILWRFYNIAFAAVTLATVVIYVAFTVSVTQWRVKVRREMNDRDSEASTKAVDSLINYETVKYFANEVHEARRFDLAKQAYMRAALRSQQTLSMLNLGQQGLMAIGLVAMLILAGRGVAAGSMTVGDFVAVNGYLLQLYMPLNFLGMVYRNVRQSLTDVEQMQRLLATPREVEDKPLAPALKVSDGSVRFERVSFAYDWRRTILDDVSFTVPPRSTVAIVGPTGSGKSTISRLLFRFYDVAEGAITIDGQDIRDVTQDSLRRAIGVVPQDTVLFNDTIYYNILYGRPEATREEVEEAARHAQLHDFVASLPDGYKTRVGERGLKLSGGEKQRVAIARVILKHPQILVFDEATSALDSHTEREIQASLREIAADRTAIVIAHRLSTVVDADEIIVLERGRIVERGRHEALLRAEGPYWALWTRQQRQREREAELVEVGE